MAITAQIAAFIAAAVTIAALSSAYRIQPAEAAAADRDIERGCRRRVRAETLSITTARPSIRANDSRQTSQYTQLVLVSVRTVEFLVACPVACPRKLAHARTRLHSCVRSCLHA